MGNRPSTSKSKLGQPAAATPSQEFSKCANGPFLLECSCKVAEEAEKPDAVAQEVQAFEGLPHQVQHLGPPRPPCEDDRVATMRALGILDAPPDPEIENILKLVTGIFDAPNALVAFFGEKRIYTANAAGAFQRGDFPWRCSFCAWTMTTQDPQILVVPDALQDARFAHNPYVCDPSGLGVRFYAGTPLVASNGHRLGTLCFADTKPRTFDAEQCLILNNLAEMVVRHTEKDFLLQLQHHDNKELTKAYANMKRAVEKMEACVALLDTSVPGFKIVYANQAWDAVTGTKRRETVGSTVSDVLLGPSPSSSGSSEPAPLSFSREHADAVAAGRGFAIAGVRLRGSSTVSPTSSSNGSRRTAGGSGARSQRSFVLRFRPASKDSFDDAALPIGVPSFVAPRSSGTPQQYYFMTIHPEQDSNVLGGSNGSTRSFSRAQVESIGAIDGLTVSHLLGKGAFGSVFSGNWMGTPVAVKVIDQDLRNLQGSGGVNVEAILSTKLLHPNIVTTLKYAVTLVEDVGPLGKGSPIFSAYTSKTALTSGGGASDGKGGINGAGGGTLRPSLDSAHGHSIPKAPATAAAVRGAQDAALLRKQVVAQGLSGLLAMNSADSTAGSSIASSTSTTVVNSLPTSTLVGVPTRLLDSDAIMLLCHPAGDQKQVTPSLSTPSSGSNPANAKKIEHAPPAAVAQPAAANDDNGHDSFDDGFSTPENGNDPFGWGALTSAPLVDAPKQMPTVRVAPKVQLPAPAAAAPWKDSDAAGTQLSPEGKAQTIMVMELCDRGCLQDAVDRGWLREQRSCVSGAPNMEAILATAMEITSGLMYMHHHNIIHGDLSSFNVLLSTNGPTAAMGNRDFVAKIADFGLARALDIQSKIQTRTYGTLTHMPPEVLMEGVLSKATDVYSLGVLMWQMYCGSRAWAGMSHGQIVLAVASKKQLAFLPGVPPAYVDLALSCMAFEPEARPSLEQIMAGLRGMQGDSTLEAHDLA